MRHLGSFVGVVILELCKFDLQAQGLLIPDVVSASGHLKTDSDKLKISVNACESFAPCKGKLERRTGPYCMVYYMAPTLCPCLANHLDLAPSLVHL